MASYHSGETLNDDLPLYSSDFSFSAWLLFTVLIIPTTILVVVFNIFCLIVLHRTRVLEESTKIFMISLNAADLSSGLLVGIPGSTARIMGWWPLGSVLCKIHGTLGSELFTASMLSVLLLTIDRYVAIYYPLRYPSLMTLARARVMVCCVWGFVLMVVSLLLFLPHLADIHEPGYKSYNVSGQRFNCYLSFQLTPHYGAYFTAIISIPTLIITILYIKIVLTALKHAKRINHEAQLGNQAGGNHLNKAKRKSLVTAAIITVTLYLCYLPEIIRVILLTLLNVKVSIVIEGLTSVLYLSNSWLNVIIYLLRNKELQKEAKALLKCPCRKF